LLGRPRDPGGAPEQADAELVMELLEGRFQMAACSHRESVVSIALAEVSEEKRYAGVSAGERTVSDQRAVFHQRQRDLVCGRVSLGA
jgi:hypothetical protein